MFGKSARLEALVDVVDDFLRETIDNTREIVLASIKGRRSGELAEDPVFQTFFGELRGLVQARALLLLVMKGSNPPERYADPDLPNLLEISLVLGLQTEMESFSFRSPDGVTISPADAVFMLSPREIREEAIDLAE